MSYLLGERRLPVSRFKEHISRRNSPSVIINEPKPIKDRIERNKEKKERKERKGGREKKENHQVLLDETGRGE